MRPPLASPCPLISVIIPVYNRPQMILTAIRSALAQTHPFTEIMVVDDGSADETPEVLAGLGDAIRLIRHSENRGQAAARNTGVAACSGDYLFFLDSDDQLEPDGLAALWDGLSRKREEDPAYVLAYGRRRTCNQHLKPIRKREKTGRSGAILPHILKDNLVRTATYIVKKDLFEACGGFEEDLIVKEDLLLHYRMAARCKIVFVDHYISRYRRHTGERARGNAIGILDQGTLHLDRFFAAPPQLAPEIRRVMPGLYAEEHLQLAKIAWRLRLPDRYLTHWSAMIRYAPAMRYHPKYLLRAAVCRVMRRKDQKPMKERR